MAPSEQGRWNIKITQKNGFILCTQRGSKIVANEVGLTESDYSEKQSFCLLDECESLVQTSISNSAYTAVLLFEEMKSLLQKYNRFIEDSICTSI